MAMKTKMTNEAHQPMMGSRKISEVTGKQHKHVARDILAMLEQLGLYSPNMDSIDFKGFIICNKEHNGRTVIDEIFLNETLSMTLVTGYDASRRLALVEQWRAMKEEREQPRIAAQPSCAANHDILSLARVVAEATASATMKAVMEVTGNNPITTAPALPAEKPQMSDAKEDPEYIPVHKVSWSTGLSDATCRRLVTFAGIPNCHIDGIRGLCVHHGLFMTAAKVLIEESAPPAKGRKRWQHPEFGGFELRKDPKEIFGGGE